MTDSRSIFFILALLISATNLYSKTYDAKDFGFQPGNARGNAIAAKKMATLLAQTPGPHTVIFENKTYDFYPQDAARRNWYISNHDQNLPRIVAFPLENVSQVTLQGNGATFNFNGRMIPFGIVKSKQVTLKQITIDFDQPQINQLDITDVKPQSSEVTFIHQNGNHRLQGSQLIFHGQNWQNTPQHGILFEADQRIAYRSVDEYFPLNQVRQIAPKTLVAKIPQSLANRLKPGQHFVARTWERPCPGIFIDQSHDTILDSVTIHYADGMGVVAQLCTNITLDALRVIPRDQSRCFSTQADATHFSGCRGFIKSTNGTYIGMMDDAINVHGTYLKIIEKIDDHTVRARYMHDQAWGFKWGDPTDKVQFVRAKTMEHIGSINTIRTIKAIDKPIDQGCRVFEITFDQLLDSAINTQEAIGIENLTWTPCVLFQHNYIANNRARGTLFSTPKPVRCLDNTFDHTSGTAILLCGDCNGWFETGACKDVLIQGNTFINGLTSAFQFCEAVISISPEIPSIKDQKSYFHSNIRIINNTFNYYDAPLLFAKSATDVLFEDNIVKRTRGYKPWHWNKARITQRNAHVTEINTQEDSPCTY